MLRINHLGTQGSCLPHQCCKWSADRSRSSPPGTAGTEIQHQSAAMTKITAICKLCDISKCDNIAFFNFLYGIRIRSLIWLSRLWYWSGMITDIVLMLEKQSQTGSPLTYNRWVKSIQLWLRLSCSLRKACYYFDFLSGSLDVLATLLDECNPYPNATHKTNFCQYHWQRNTVF